jgi:hypothetical protein
MAPLVEGDDSPVREVFHEAIPVARVGAQSVEKEDWRVGLSGGVRPPLRVVQADALSLQPTVDRFGHRS